LRRPSRQGSNGEGGVMAETHPLIVYGRLLEAFHLSGYAFERAYSELEYMLAEGRWMATGFDDVHQFVTSIDLSKFRHSVEQRKKFAGLLKQAEVSQRAIASMLGVDPKTIRNDRAESSSPPAEKASDINGEILLSGDNSSPPQWWEQPVDPAEQVQRQIDKQEKAGARLERVRADEQRILKLRPIDGKFRTIVLDPAWDYDWLSLAGRAKPGYAMQTHEELLALDVRAWADEEVGCHLYLWTTNNFMGRACQLLAHWGFQHRTVLTWIKPPPFGLGSYFRNSTEQCLFGTLGDTTTRPAAASIATHFEAPRGEDHSDKPEEFYDIVRAASYPPYGEGNQREPRPDFANLYETIEEEAAA
jgi:N6-adenosine-specific RNA methylase IME4